jgi:hypothetical protein
LLLRGSVCGYCRSGSAVQPVAYANHTEVAVELLVVEIMEVCEELRIYASQKFPAIAQRDTTNTH